MQHGSKENSNGFDGSQGLTVYTTDNSAARFLLVVKRHL